MQHLFEGGYYFPSLTVKHGVNSRVATKQGAASIRRYLPVDSLQ